MFMLLLSSIPTVDVSIRTISPLEISFCKLNVSYFVVDSLSLLSDISLVGALSVESLIEALSVESLVGSLSDSIIIDLVDLYFGEVP